MIRSKLLLGVATATLLLGLPLVGPVSGLPIGTSAAMAQDAKISFSIFFDNLAQHGRWVRHPHYQYVWCPTVDRTWAPYTHGHWVYLASRGWYFDSDEPFAWAAYHYGRWYQDTDLGWCWVPGNVWAPAWVTWRKSNDYVGWAPLPPESDGFSIGVRISNADVPRERWYFIPARSFLHPQLSGEIVFGSRQPDVFDRTQPAGTVVVQNNIVVNNVITVNFIEQQTNQKVTEVKAQTVTDPNAVKATPTGQGIAVFDAQIDQPKKDEAPKQVVDPAQAAQDQKAAAPAGNASAPASNTAPATPTTPDSSAKPAPAANATDQTAKPAANANGKPTLPCAEKDMVNGVCPPDKNGAKPASSATPTPAKPATAPVDPAKPASPAAGTAATPPAANAPTLSPDTEVKPTAGAGAGKGNGAKPADCPKADIVNGVCQPPKPKGDAAPAVQPAPATNDQVKPAPGSPKAAVEQQVAPSTDANAGNQKSATGAPAKGKPTEKCLPGQQLLDGVCQPKDAAKGAATPDAAPAN